MLRGTRSTDFAKEWSGLVDASLVGRPIVDGPIGPGVVVLDRYEILNVIGQGGVGIVYLAEHVEHQQRCAIKILSGEWSTNRFVVRRFRAEARTAGAIGHPNVLRVEEAGAFADGRLYVVMEYLEGVDLRRELGRVRALEPLRACVVMRQVALALAAVHALGVIHRDLKPSNIMVVPQPGGGELAKVLDFGIAANTTTTGLHGEDQQRPGWVLGAPQYMAPEQATGGTPSPAVDIYAFGVILYELLTGTPPITAEHSFELLAFKRHNPAPSLRERAPELPDTLIALVDECLEIDPARRPPDAAALVSRLEEVIEEQHGDIVPIRITAAEGRTVRRRRRLGLAVSGAVLAAAAALFVTTAGGRSEPQDPVAAPPAPAPAPAPAAPSVESLAPSQPRAVVAPLAPIAPLAPPDDPEDEPDPGKSARPRARPSAARDRPADDPPPAVAPKTASKAATPECERVRKAAEEARSAHQWSSLRNHSRRRECWQDPAEARKLLTKAMMEIGDYAECVAVGDGLKDPDVVEWVQLCRLRGGA